MVDQASETLFFQDNLMSEDDWGGHLSFADFDHFTSNDQSKPSDDFYLGEEARYRDQYVNELNNFESNELSSPEIPSPLFSPPTSDCNFVDELLQDLLQAKKGQNVTDDVRLQQSSSRNLEQRCSSTHTSSSSAYSSCSDSGTPSPVEQFSDHGSCSSVEFQEQNTLTIDLTSLSDTDNMCPASSDGQICKQATNIRNSSVSYPESNVKSRGYKRATSLTKDLMKATELEKAVRQACEETNRLLRLHKQLSGKAEAELTSEKAMLEKPQDRDILKSLCEETILSDFASLPKSKSHQPPPMLEKPKKRKASTLQDAIDRLQSANKSMCLDTMRTNQPTPFSRSALLSNPSHRKPLPNTIQMDSKSKEPCIIVTSTQPPPPRQNLSLDSVMLNGTQTYTLTPTVSSASQPIQFYIKQESSPTQSCQVVGNLYQQQTMQMQNMVPVSNQKVIVSNRHSPNVTFSGAGVSVGKPEQILCSNGQTIVIQRPSQNLAQPVLRPVNISNMKPSAEPLALSQSDLLRLAAQGVIKFPATQNAERCLVPVSDENKALLKPDAQQTTTVPKSLSSFSTACDMLPADAVGIINGTSVFVGGLDNQPRLGELNIKALKRHQRMIKNRESACESRQRRKEYLKTMEDQVTEVNEENRILQEKNYFLVSRVHEVEMENKNLRDLLCMKRSHQKKTACVLMLMLFVGINVFQTGLFDTGSPMPSVVSQDSLRTGRHLLSIIEDEAAEPNETNPQRSLEEKSLMVQEKQSYWMDDLVQRYKDKHLQNFLQLLSETTSNSVKRMLRRKLKEELGIIIPLPVPRSRRIAYTPQLQRQRMYKMSQASELNSQKAHTIPPIAPKINKADVKIPPSLPQPCEQPSLEESALNETEASRVNEDLIQWAKRYTVERQEKAQKSAEKRKPAGKRIRNTKSPSSRYEDHDNTSTNEIALYTRPNKKYHDFLEAINRRNDTLYIVTLNKDHLLLPATERNTSSRLKMTIVMPAITSKDHPTHADYETMIEIKCEVLNTRMFDLKRAGVPDFLDVTPVKGTVKTLDNASNETISQPTKSTLQSTRAADKKQWHNDYRRDETEKSDDEQDAVVAVVSDVTEPEFYRIPKT